MTEFRIAPNKISEQRRERRIWLVVWGIVLSLLGITVFAVSGANSASHQLNIALAYLAGLMVLSIVAGAYFLIFRHGIRNDEARIDL